MGNFPALFRPGPRILGICLIKESEAKKALYFFAVEYIKFNQNYHAKRKCVIINTANSKLLDTQGWKILKISTRPPSPFVLVNSIINIGNSEKFYLSYSIRHSLWRADEMIFPALIPLHSTGE